jgi:murein DD-endopeptidase MepM/ murein hydrolase activator NlpD
MTWNWGPNHRDPFTGGEVFHRGVDLAAKSGTPVVAPADGVVLVATDTYEPSQAAGTVVIIDHGNGLTTFHAHLEDTAVVEGQNVTQGQTIATVGSTGKSTGPHLHFEVRRDGEAVDPAQFVAAWRD